MSSRSERLNGWYAEQTTLSRLIGGSGALALGLVLLGSAVLLTLGGLTPWQSLFETATSETQEVLLLVGIGVGALATVGAILTYRTMPTKAARETVISGGALGVQAIIFSLLYLLIRSGDLFDVFIRQFFNFNLLGDFFGAFVRGAVNTLIMALSGEALGIAIGLMMSLLILSNRAVVRAPARTYVNFFRGTPLLWQLNFGFFGVVIGLQLDLGAFAVGILILGINAGAYTAEIFRAGIQSIERGQMEAARSLGMSYLQAMRYVILPQAIGRVIPPLTNEFVILIKDTSLIFILGLTATERELMTVARDAYSDLFNATPFLGAVAGYLVVTLPMIRAVTALESRLRSGLAGIAGL